MGAHHEGGIFFFQGSLFCNFLNAVWMPVEA
jgi:hypothetical protein